MTMKNIHAIHLYRGILRHAGILYDDIARAQIYRMARQGFENNRTVKNKAELRALHKEGRESIHLLQRANLGVEKAINKLLRRAYGRTGRRRHELMKPLLEFPCPDPPPLISGVNDSRPPKMPPPFIAVLKWAKLPNVFPNYPTTNRWGSGMSAQRIKNMYKRNYKKLHKDCPAPLPGDEYEALVRRANGDEDPVPPRRKIIPPSMLSEQFLDKRDRAREVTARGWRRIWHLLLDDTPGMYINGDKEMFRLVDVRGRERIATETRSEDVAGNWASPKVKMSDVRNADKGIGRRGKWRL